MNFQLLTWFHQLTSLSNSKPYILFSVYFLCHILLYACRKAEKMHFLLPSTMCYVNDLSRMDKKRSVRRDMFQVSLRLLSQTLLSKPVISGPLCCFLSDTRLRRGIDPRGRWEGGRVGGREGDNSITICLSDALHRLPQCKAALGPAMTDLYLTCSALA